MSSSLRYEKPDSDDLDSQLPDMDGRGSLFVYISGFADMESRDDENASLSF
jgi:hypothetical protein